MALDITTGNSAAWQILWICVELFFLFTFFALAAAFIFLSTSYYQRKAAAQGIKASYFEGSGESTQKIRIGRAILSTLLFIFMSLYFVPQLFEFQSVRIQDDSSWKLKNMFGIPLATIPATEKRDIVIDDRQLTFYNTYRKVDVNFIAIVTPKKTYLSLGGEYKNIKAMSKQLAAQAKEKNTLEYFEPTYNFQRIAYTRYVLMGLMFLVGWWFWRKKTTPSSPSSKL